MPFLEKAGINTSMAFAENVCGLMKERATFIPDMLEGKYFFIQPNEYHEQTFNKKWKEKTPEILSGFRKVLEEIQVFTSSNIESSFKEYLERNEYSIGSVIPNLRLLITGIGSGPSIFDIIELLGKEETLSRIVNGLNKLTSTQIK